MLALLFANLQASAFRTLKGAVIAFGACFALFVGFSFLTLAAWVFLVSVTSVVAAALILGFIFTGTGLILVSMITLRARARKRAEMAAAAAAAVPSAAGVGGLAGLVLAFITGMTAAQKARF